MPAVPAVPADLADLAMLAVLAVPAGLAGLADPKIDKLHIQNLKEKNQPKSRLKIFENLKIGTVRSIRLICRKQTTDVENGIRH